MVRKSYVLHANPEKPVKFEFKEPNYNIIKPAKPKTAIERAKESIRKLPMFETFSDSVADFEWPSKQ